MVSLLLRRRNIQTPIGGETVILSCLFERIVLVLTSAKTRIFCRIVLVDLKFPPKPIVSSAAKDLISKVNFFLI